MKFLFLGLATLLLLTGCDTWNNQREFNEVPVREYEWVTVEPGVLRMGTDDEGWQGKGNEMMIFQTRIMEQYELDFDPLKYDETPEFGTDVRIFQMAKYETTRAQYAEFVNAVNYRVPQWDGGMRREMKERYYRETDEWQRRDGKWYPAEGTEDWPVNLVSWHDCKNYALWAGYRLPTEKEWEWAANGPENYDYPWGNTFNDEANIGWQGDMSQAEPVGSRPKDVSWSGVYDLGGNAMEWVDSPYKSYPGAEQTFERYEFAINRGGSWGYTGIDQYTYSRFIVEKEGPEVRWHDVTCRLARNV
jgi:formylglycine-generating enzyme required for sulfatase activity